MDFRVLIIEDNNELRYVMRLYLEEAGFKIFEATDCKDALNICAHEQPHLLILDVYLKSELGLDVATAIKEDPFCYGNPRIIVVSGTVGGHLWESNDFFEEHNVNYFMKKPLDFPVLINKVKELLDI